MRFWLIVGLIIFVIGFLLRKYLGRVILIVISLFLGFMIFRWINIEKANSFLAKIINLPHVFLEKLVDNNDSQITKEQNGSFQEDDRNMSGTQILEAQITDIDLNFNDSIQQEGVLYDSIGIVATGPVLDPIQYFIDEQGNYYHIQGEIVEESMVSDENESDRDSSDYKIQQNGTIEDLNQKKDTPSQAHTKKLSPEDLKEAESIFNLNDLN